jgi:hypothetical protein
VRCGATDVNFSHLPVQIGDPNPTTKVAVVYSPEGTVPRYDAEKISFINSSDLGTNTKRTAQDIMRLKDGEFAVFVSGNDYSVLAEDSSNGLKARKDMQEAKANLWLVPIVDGVGASESITSGALQTLRVRADQVTENVYEWLHDRKIDFETYTKEGFGDVDCTFFYNHMFNKALTAEVFGGFKAPTGGKIKWHKNPYKVNLGSGHWELKAGAMASWSPTNMFGLKAEAYYGYVTSEVEERHATFKNATIKIGPRVLADVKWDYCVANLDLNVAHFSAKDITGMIGYQVYYKRHDSVKFKASKQQTWLEKIYNSTTKTYSVHESTLDPLLAEANTDSIAHRVRFETSFIMTDWLEFYAGGAWTFAGRNALRSADAHLGFNIAF